MSRSNKQNDLFKMIEELDTKVFDYPKRGFGNIKAHRLTNPQMSNLISYLSQNEPDNPDLESLRKLESLRHQLKTLKQYIVKFKI